MIENKRVGKTFYLLAAVMVFQIAGALVVGLLVAPASVFVSRGETEAFMWMAFGIAALALAALGAVLIVLSIVAAVGAARGKNWFRFVGAATATLAILEFPLGTIFGGYLLWRFKRR